MLLINTVCFGDSIIKKLYKNIIAGTLIIIKLMHSCKRLIVFTAHPFWKSEYFILTKLTS